MVFSHRIARQLMCQLVLALALLTLASPVRSAPAAQVGSGPIYIAEVGGTVTSVTIGYLRRALQIAEAADAQALIITLSSGGGVLRDIRPFAGDLASARVRRAPS
jgi:membrane-bound serine protease (ClpP class)